MNSHRSRQRGLKKSFGRSLIDIRCMSGVGASRKTRGLIALATSILPHGGHVMAIPITRFARWAGLLLTIWLLALPVGTALMSSCTWRANWTYRSGLGETSHTVSTDMSASTSEIEAATRQLRTQANCVVESLWKSPKESLSRTYPQSED